MREVTGDLFTYPCDARVITTNGAVRRDGACVMGRGVAAQAKALYPALPFQIGSRIREFGNNVFFVGEFGIITFPVKTHWSQRADIALIARSADQLAELADSTSWLKTIAMPRAGCGNGQLRWEHVAPFLKPVLDDRFVVVERNP